MEQRTLGPVGPVSVLTLGGGGLGQVWGATTREECVATVREAAESGITLFDMAPLYGNGLAEEVLGEAFAGRLPAGVRVSTKCLLGNPPAEEVLERLERSLNESLARMRLDYADLFILHGRLAPDGQGNRASTTYQLFVAAVRPAFEDLVRRGRIGAWGITAVEWPSIVLQVLSETPGPAAVQCITNLLDSPGGMKTAPEPSRPRDLISAAHAQGIGVMGIRAVQAGALTDALDRELPDESPEMVDYRRAAPFRALAREAGEAPAVLAHRYTMSMSGVSTVVLGVKNRSELRECVDAAARGPLSAEMIARIDSAVDLHAAQA
jgi:aryl-alcohol dehydrogenase-like predicted oxidoreductase